MAAALVASTLAGSTDGNGVTTSSITTTTANLIVLVVASYASNPIPSISDSKGNSYTALTSYTDGAGFCRQTIFYRSSPTVGTLHTFSAYGTGAYPVVSVLAFTGAISSTPFDAGTGGGTGTTVTSRATGSVTPALSGSIIVAGLTCLSAGAPDGLSINNGFAVSGSVGFVTLQRFGCGSGYLIQPSATAINPSFSWTTPSACAVAIASFKPDAGSSGPTLTQLRRGLCRGLGRGFRR